MDVTHVLSLIQQWCSCVIWLSLQKFYRRREIWKSECLKKQNILNLVLERESIKPWVLLRHSGYSLYIHLLCAAVPQMGGSRCWQQEMLFCVGNWRAVLGDWECPGELHGEPPGCPVFKTMSAGSGRDWQFCLWSLPDSSLSLCSGLPSEVSSDLWLCLRAVELLPTSWSFCLLLSFLRSGVFLFACLNEQLFLWHSCVLCYIKTQCWSRCWV